MTTDLTLTENGIVNPQTGEEITPNSPPEDIGQLLVALKEHGEALNAVKRDVSRWFIDHLDRQACWSLSVPGFKLSAPSPQPVEEFDGPALREALLDLVDEGVLSIEAVDKAVETVVTYEPRRRGIGALRKRGGRVAAVVDAHAREVEKNRYVSVKPL